MISGTDAITELIGYYEPGIITSIYGPASAGKTCLCMLASIDVVRQGKKVIYIDAEGGFSIIRMQQLADDYEAILGKMIFLRPTSFDEQKKLFDRFLEMISDKIGLIIIDTIGMLYRIELSRCKDVSGVNNELVSQLSVLTKAARNFNIPIIVTNQVYADFENQGQVKIVGGDILKYASKCMIELQKAKGGFRKAILRKHRHIAEGKEINCEIREKGIFLA